MPKHNYLTSDPIQLPKCRLSYLKFWTPDMNKKDKCGVELLFPPKEKPALDKLDAILVEYRKKFKEKHDVAAAKPPKVRQFPYPSADNEDEMIKGPEGCEDWFSLRTSFFKNENGVDLRVFRNGDFKKAEQHMFYSGCWAIPIVKIQDYPAGDDYKGGLQVKTVCLQFISDDNRFGGGNRDYTAHLVPVEAGYKAPDTEDEDDF